MNLPNFWYGSCSYGVLWENHTLYAGKILVWQNFGHFKAKIWPVIFKRCYEWYYFWYRTCSMGFFVFIGSPDVFRLRKEPINSLSYVRTSVRTCVPVLQPWPFNIFFLTTYGGLRFWPPWPHRVKYLSPWSLTSQIFFSMVTYESSICLHGN